MLETAINKYSVCARRFHYPALRVSPWRHRHSAQRSARATASSKTGAAGASSELCQSRWAADRSGEPGPGGGRGFAVTRAGRCLWQLLCSGSSLGTGAACGCSSPRGAAAAHASARGKLESTCVDAVAAMLPCYKPISVIPLLMADEIKTGKPEHGARAGLGCWGGG